MLKPESLADCVCGRPVLVDGHFIGCETCRPSPAGEAVALGWSFVRDDDAAGPAFIISSHAGAARVRQGELGFAGLLYAMANDVVRKREELARPADVSLTNAGGSGFTAA